MEENIFTIAVQFPLVTSLEILITGRSQVQRWVHHINMNIKRSEPL